MERWKVSSKYGLPIVSGIPSYIQTYTHVLCMIPNDTIWPNKLRYPSNVCTLTFKRRFEFFTRPNARVWANFYHHLSVKVSESQQTNLPIDTVALRVDGLDSLVQSAAVRSASFDVISPRENIPTIKISPLVLRIALCNLRSIALRFWCVLSIALKIGS